MSNITHFYIDEWKQDGIFGQTYVLYNTLNKSIARIYNYANNKYSAYIDDIGYSEHRSLTEAKQYIKFILAYRKFKPLPNELKILL
jgi:hypothetical protein